MRRRRSSALVAFADAHPRAAVVGPRLLNPDGSLQRSVRGEPTLWRLATEYLFLRKLAPRLERAERVLRRRLRPRRSPREVESLYGAALLVRREAADEVGLFDERFFMFSEETDWLHRFRARGLGGLVLAGGGGRAPRRRLARRPALRGEPARDPRGTSPSTAGRR